MNPSLQSLNHNQSAKTLLNVEISYRPTSEITSRLTFISSGIRSPFSQTFTSFEGEDRANWPIENEEEEILMFKQRIIESSVSKNQLFIYLGNHLLY